MKWSSVLSASRGRALVVLGIALLGASVEARSNGTPALANAVNVSGASQAQQDPLKFNTDSPLLIVFMIKPDKAADFEAGWKMLRDQFDKSDRPEVKEFAGTISYQKVDGKLIGINSPPEAPVVYLFHVAKPSKTQSYNPVEIIYTLLWKKGEAGGIPRPEADDIYKKLDNSNYVQIIPWALTKMGG